MTTKLRQLILKIWVCLFVVSPLAALSGPPAIRIETEPSRALVNFLGWDTEGGGRANTNLLQAGTGVTMRVRIARALAGRRRNADAAGAGGQEGNPLSPLGHARR